MRFPQPLFSHRQSYNRKFFQPYDGDQDGRHDKPQYAVSNDFPKLLAVLSVLPAPRRLSENAFFRKT